MLPSTSPNFNPLSLSFPLDTKTKAGQCALPPNTNNEPSNVPLSQFIIGRWNKTDSGTVDGRTSINEYQVEFVDAENLVYNEKTSQSKRYNLGFRYEFIGENRIKIKGRLNAEWDLVKDGSNLIISPRTSFGIGGVFRKSPSISWPVVASIFMIVILLVGIRSGHFAKEDRIVSTIFYASYINRFFIIASLGIGMLTGWYAWLWWTNLFIRLPWDAVIFGEISTLLLMLSARKIFKHKYSMVYPIAFVDKWIYLLGWFFSGASLVGIVLSILKLSVFIYFGSYGFDA